jgi:DNA polymerase-3 subunit beta
MIRPVLQCVLFSAKEDKLTLVSADGFRLAVVSLDYDDGEGETLINRDELAGITNALRRAKRARLAFEGEDIKTLVLDTELTRYKWVSQNGKYPDWEKLVPQEHKLNAQFDTLEAVKAVSSLKALSDAKAYPIDLTIGEGKMVLANPDDRGQAEIPADTDGEASRIRLDGRYLAEALKACGGMVDLKLSSSSAPALFTTDGYQLVVMPMLTTEAKEQEKCDEEAEETEKPEETAEEKTTEPEAEAKVAKPAESKPKRSRVKEPVTA